MRNVELIERVMEYILDHPRQHQQGAWISECGTAACFAGWTCLLSGFEQLRNSAGHLYDSLIVDDSDPDGWAEIPRKAEELLGLTEDEAGILFHPTNTQTMLKRMVGDLVNGTPLLGREAYK